MTTTTESIAAIAAQFAERAYLLDAEIERLQAQRKPLLDDVVAELRWIDLEVHRVPVWRGDVDGRISAGSHVHLLEAWYEDEPAAIDKRIHAAEGCGTTRTAHWCNPQRLGEDRTPDRKGERPFFRFRGAYEVILRDGDEVVVVPARQARG